MVAAPLADARGSAAAVAAPLADVGGSAAWDLPNIHHNKSASAIATAEIAIIRGETISSGSETKRRARNAISTVSQIRSYAQLSSELDPPRLFHQDCLLFQLIGFRLPLLGPGCTRVDGLLGLMKQLDTGGELLTLVVQRFAKACFGFLCPMCFGYVL